MGRKHAFRDTTTARHAFRRAAPPLPGALAGDWDLEPLGGEAWEKVRGWRDRALGIHGVTGLRFAGVGMHHLVGKPKKAREERPLAVDLGTSAFDGAQVVRCDPTPDLGPAWSFVHYEVRALEDDRLIGLDVLGPDSWALPMPFLLHRREG